MAAAVLPATGSGPDDHGRPGSPGPARATPPVLLGQQVIGVAVDEQLDKHRVHAVPPRPATASLIPGATTAESRVWAVRYGWPTQE